MKNKSDPHGTLAMTLIAIMRTETKAVKAMKPTDWEDSEKLRRIVDIQKQRVEAARRAGV